MSPLPDISPMVEVLRWLLSFGALGLAYWLGRSMTRLSDAIEHLAETTELRFKMIESRLDALGQ